MPSGDHWSGPTVRAPAGASASQRCAAPSARTTQTPSRSPCSPTYAICLPSGENDGSAPEPTLRLWRLSRLSTRRARSRSKSRWINLTEPGLEP